MDKVPLKTLDRLQDSRALNAETRQAIKDYLSIPAIANELDAELD